MRLHLYIDENVLAHLDDPDVQRAFEGYRSNGLLPVISYHHLTEICRSPHFERYISRIERLDPFYLSSVKSEQLKKFGSVDLEPIDARLEVLSHRKNISPLEISFFGVITPLLKLLGGLEQIDRNELLDQYVNSMREISMCVFNSDGESIHHDLYSAASQMVTEAEIDIRKSFSTIDFEEDSVRWATVRDKVVKLGNIGQLPAERLPEAVLGQMTNDDRREIDAMFPRGFGKEYPSRAEKLMQFALLLYSLGALTGTRKNFSGDQDKQINRFRSQILDCLHIGEAGYFQAFLTCDIGAHRLASAVYSHAGVPTLALKMTIQPAEKLPLTS